MIVIIFAKYRKNPSRTVDATEGTRFSKSRPNDLEDIGQGQGSSHTTHPLMLLIICTKYGKNPFWTVDATGRTRKVNGQTDRQTGWIQYTPLTSLRGYKNNPRAGYKNNPRAAFIEGNIKYIHIIIFYHIPTLKWHIKSCLTYLSAHSGFETDD